LWAIPVCLGILIVAVLAHQDFWQTVSPVVNPPFSFRAYHVADALRVEWDPNSASIRSATQAVLEMKAGNETRQYPLTAAQLREGKLAYPRQASDVELRMTVYPAAGPPVQEFARLVGPPSQPSATERDRLEAEVKRLKEELRKERQKNKKSAQKSGPTTPVP
ncbi:MAG TPA: hypothetical protein VGV35_06910, partial [Bryobacteraceae bacterium]|nr:hypothetical protein [Bryobacteraceae bacterium]